MIITLNNLDDLKRERSLIDSLYSDFGKIYLQNYLSLTATYMSKTKGDFFIFLDKKNKLMSAFEKKSDNIRQCSISGYPVLCSKNVSSHTLKIFLETIKQKLGVNTLYFPLVYQENNLFSKFRDIKDMYFWLRLPCPIIKGDFSEKVIWNRVLDRYGNRANRQKKKFEKNLSVKPINMKDVETIIEKIETNSWKRTFHQDMMSRDNQFNYYTNIIKSGIADITVAFDRSNQPVAFRIDAIANQILYVIKWSYDQRYKQFSPGFYLLTVELFRKYNQSSFCYIDLYGSPDILKNQIESARLKRVDFCYSSNVEEVEVIKNERISYDHKIFDNYQNQQSIQKLFNC